MARTSGRVKRWTSRVFRTKNGGNDDEVPPLLQAQSGSIGSTAPTEDPATSTPRGAKRRRESNDGAGDDDDDDTPAEELHATPRGASMWASSVSASMSASFNPDRIPILQSTPERDEIEAYRQAGVKFEDWMANTNQSADVSGVAQSTLTLDDLTKATSPNDEPCFTVPTTGYAPPPAEIRVALGSLPRNPGRDDYRRTSLQRNKYRKVSTYEHYIVRGAIIAANIERREGPYWNDIALALYKYGAPINTLRHVFMLHVKNDETLPLVGKVFYKQRGLSGGPKDRSMTPTIQTWRRRTEDFRCILGTQLGRAVGRLVLAAWPAGTHQVSEIHTWFIGGKLHMRFDIEVIKSAAASGSAGARP